jgi:hypothetical protein
MFPALSSTHLERDSATETKYTKQFIIRQILMVNPVLKVELEPLSRLRLVFTLTGQNFNGMD